MDILLTCQVEIWSNFLFVTITVISGFGQEMWVTLDHCWQGIPRGKVLFFDICHRCVFVSLFVVCPNDERQVVKCLVEDWKILSFVCYTHTFTRARAPSISPWSTAGNYTHRRTVMCERAFFSFSPHHRQGRAKVFKKRWRWRRRRRRRKVETRWSTCESDEKWNEKCHSSEVRGRSRKWRHGHEWEAELEREKQNGENETNKICISLRFHSSTVFVRCLYEPLEERIADAMRMAKGDRKRGKKVICLTSSLLLQSFATKLRSLPGWFSMAERTDLVEASPITSSGDCDEQCAEKHTGGERKRKRERERKSEQALFDLRDKD